jgi:hypothetical protein
MTDAAVNVVKGVAGLPAELVAQLNSDDPQVRGMALVSALTLGSVATAVTVKLGLGAAGKFIPSIKLGTVVKPGAEIGVTGETAAEPVILGAKLGNDDATIKAIQWLKPQDGFYDVVVHGTPDSVAIRIGNDWQFIDQRSLATYIGKQADYSGGAIRLASCQTGACDAGFAQNLANKMGVPVMAPTDKLFVFSSGKIVIGPNQFTNSGQWKTFYPGN